MKYLLFIDDGLADHDLTIDDFVASFNSAEDAVKHRDLMHGENAIIATWDGSAIKIQYRHLPKFWPPVYKKAEWEGWIIENEPSEYELNRRQQIEEIVEATDRRLLGT